MVVGCPSYRPPEGAAPDGVGGMAAGVATAVAAAGGGVQLIGRIGDDAAGDALVLALGRAGVGHAAMLRDPGRPTPLLAAAAEAAEVAEDDLLADLDAGAALADAVLGAEGASSAPAPAELLLPERPEERPRLEAADIELALRYLPEVRVIVLAEPIDEASARVVADEAAGAGAQVIVIVAPGTSAPDALAGATVLEAPPGDPDGAFARLVAAFAVALDAGAAPAEAFRSAAASAGWEAATA